MADLLVPDASAIFPPSIEPTQLLRFFSDFELVTASEQPLAPMPSPFLYGREPQWNDLHQHIDIERQDNDKITNLVVQNSALSVPGVAPIVLVLDDAGTGKTTTIKRVAHTLARSGRPVLTVRTLDRIDTSVAAACLSRSTVKLLLVVDGLAGHAEQVLELLENDAVASQVLVLATERSYRQEYLDVVLGDTRLSTLKLLPFTLEECEQLLERYRQFGLIGTPTALRQPSTFAKQLLGDPVAIAVCRILNDFRPLDAIVASLWEAADEHDRLPYLCIALAQHCYRAGLRYSLLQAITGPSRPIGRLLDTQVPLKLTTNAVDDDFIVAINGIMAERVLYRASQRDPQILQAAFAGIASVLAPHVNRQAIMRRSPEARLAGRLFDADKVVRPLLGAAAEDFYLSIQQQWEWNSRYWEQRALLTAETNLDIALQYARHAVAIEMHPFPLTTLGKLLLRRMETTPINREGVFAEAFDKLRAAIESEARRSRITVHPFATLLAGTVRYLELGGQLMADQHNKIAGYATEARERFADNTLMNNALSQLDELLGSRT